MSSRLGIAVEMYCHIHGITDAFGVPDINAAIVEMMKERLEKEGIIRLKSQALIQQIPRKEERVGHDVDLVRQSGD